MKKNSRSSWKPATKLNHPERVLPPAGNDPLVSPLYQSAKFRITPELSLGEQYIYSRVANPTVRELELSLAEIQGQEECVVVASGMAAISMSLLALLKSQDEILMFRETYRPARMLVRSTLPQFGISAAFLKNSELDDLETKITPKTKIIYFESPANPHLQLLDIEKIVGLAKKHNIITIMDGTFAGLHQQNDLGIDLIIHSLTKYANGHGDVIAGSVSGRKDLIAKVRAMNVGLGTTLDPHAASLISRGLKTYFMRFSHQSKSASEVVRFLQDHPKVRKVYYPGLHTEDRALADKYLKEKGGILSFEIDPSVGPAEAFCHRLSLIQFTVSVGSVDSLICPTEKFFGEDFSLEEREELGMNPYSLRLSVGLEDVADLKEDMNKALK